MVVRLRVFYGDFALANLESPRLFGSQILSHAERPLCVLPWGVLGWFVPPAAVIVVVVRRHRVVPVPFRRLVVWLREVRSTHANVFCCFNCLCDISRSKPLLFTRVRLGYVRRFGALARRRAT